jgi:hypothetical protein
MPIRSGSVPSIDMPAGRVSLSVTPVSSMPLEVTGWYARDGHLPT